MVDDEITEIRQVRHKISERYGHDVKRLVAHYQELQKELEASGKYKLATPYSKSNVFLKKPVF